LNITTAPAALSSSPTNSVPMTPAESNPSPFAVEAERSLEVADGERENVNPSFHSSPIRGRIRRDRCSSRTFRDAPGRAPLRERGSWSGGRRSQLAALNEIPVALLLRLGDRLGPIAADNL
jgi:hypothetical protein